MLGKRKKNANLSGRPNFNNTILFCGNKNKKLTSDINVYSRLAIILQSMLAQQLVF